MVRAYYLIRLVVELICKLIFMGFFFTLFLVAAFQTSIFVALGMGIVFLLAIPRALKSR